MAWSTKTCSPSIIALQWPTLRVISSFSGFNISVDRTENVYAKLLKYGLHFTEDYITCTVHSTYMYIVCWLSKLILVITILPRRYTIVIPRLWIYFGKLHRQTKYTRTAFAFCRYTFSPVSFFDLTFPKNGLRLNNPYNCSLMTDAYIEYCVKVNYTMLSKV